jgi:hypothetical protein
MVSPVGDKRCYRVYILDEHGQVEAVLNLDCADDFSAQEQVKRLADGYEVELWRLVAQFKFDDRRHRPKRRRSAFAPTR